MNAEELVQQLRCHHAYHPHCLAVWLRRSPLCPLCKRSVLVSELVHSEEPVATGTLVGTETGTLVGAGIGTLVGTGTLAGAGAIEMTSRRVLVRTRSFS